jgi:hypothetical protein
LKERKRSLLSLFQNRRFWKEACRRQASYNKARNLIIRFRMPFYSFFSTKKKKEEKRNNLQFFGQDRRKKNSSFFRIKKGNLRYPKA